MILLLAGLVVVCLVAYLLWYALNQIPLPQPIRIVATVLFILIVVIALLNYLPMGAIPRGRWG